MSLSEMTKSPDHWEAFPPNIRSSLRSPRGEPSAKRTSHLIGQPGV